MAFFRAYKAGNLKVPTYFIESTAPDNVDDTQPVDPISEIPEKLKPHLQPVEPADNAVKEIAARLASGENPNLVVMVHGFNNPEPTVLKMYAEAAIAIHKDDAIQSDGLVCVGYRWPSEKMFTILGSSWGALPLLPRWLVFVGLVIFALAALLFYVAAGSLLGHAFVLSGLIITGVIAMAVLLRVIVYFRDNYRAANFGVPDLIHIIRAIHHKLGEERESLGLKKEPERRIELSFIGHSMGGFVVTNTIRTLVDVFKTPVAALSSFGADAPRPDQHLHEIGDMFELKRFVLVSPDIPAETLLSDRGNFLASALTRFHEAYLFSNEGDEVLRQISTLANYFTFPTKSNDHGFRLGNVEILSSAFGLIRTAPGEFLDILRIGDLTLGQLYGRLEDFAASRGVTEKKRKEPHLPKVFSYFDCTDYVDTDNDGVTRPLLTFAKWFKRYDKAAKMPFLSHLRLLLAYLLFKQRPNVHAGYFEGQLSQKLIYRLACLGFEGTRKAFGGLSTLDGNCREKQIRALLSPDPRIHGHGEAAVQEPHQEVVQKADA